MPPTHNYRDGDDDEEARRSGCCKCGRNQYRYGDDGERTGTDDRGGDYKNTEK